jgi:hypothetical protein
MKVLKTRDHSPVKVRNEINIKINNNNTKPSSSKRKKSTKSEEDALDELSNLEYNDKAIMTKNGQGYARGSGGSIILPHYNSSNEKNILETILSPQKDQSNGLTNQLKNQTTLGSKPADTVYQDPNQSTTFSNIKEQTATVEFLDDPQTPAIDEGDEDLTAEEKYLAIEDAKAKKRGRPLGSKNKPKSPLVEQQNEPTTSPQFESPVQQTGQASHSMFDNPDNAFQQMPMKDRAKLQAGNAYTRHLEERKMATNQV